jgi:plasmid stabilization system protein ParE
LKILWLPSAARNRREQILFIAQDKPSAALKQNTLIEARVRLLAQFPELGTYNPKADSYRLVINRTRFIVSYRIRGNRIEIFRFLHGKQKPL